MEKKMSTAFVKTDIHENLLLTMAPLLETTQPTDEIYDFFSKYGKTNPNSSLVIELFKPVVQRILKRNTDFGIFPRMRLFVQEYLQALSCQTTGHKAVKDFIKSMHGPTSCCPHPRVLPNLVTVAISAVRTLYDEQKVVKREPLSKIQLCQTEWEKKLLCYLDLFETISTYEDWRLPLGTLLQPVPFPTSALTDDLFTSKMKNVVASLAADHVCDVHKTILGIREGKEGWFQFYCPGNVCCDDDGELWGKMLTTLINCCCLRKQFLTDLTSMIGPVMLLTLREDFTAITVLCAMLEMDIIDNNDLKMQIMTTLESTMDGKRMYADLCEREVELKELQQKGGPKNLTLPLQATDADLAQLLSSGSFGNLENLNLAFTKVTCNCAKYLIKLPSLRRLNFWSSRFGDVGLQLISDNLQNLEELNLCETYVTDKGISAISALKNLQKLNLNSTNVSALVFADLKEQLPALQECDVRYTDAWRYVPTE